MSIPFFEACGSPVAIIAIGGHATGVIAIGGFAQGFIAIGQGATGVFCAGQLSYGFVTLGQLTCGVYYSVGQLAFAGKGLGQLFVPLLPNWNQKPNSTGRWLLAALQMTFWFASWVGFFLLVVQPLAKIFGA